MAYKIKDWSKFQHFKDRKPPWIKLYRDLLDDLEWHELDPLAAKALVAIWLIASENDGCLPDTKKLAFRLRLSEKQTISIVSQLSHWLIQDDITMISDRYQDDSLEKEIETEIEKETEREREARPRATRLNPNWQPSIEEQDFARQLGIDPHTEADRFRDYWTAQAGQRATKANWTATWRNWCRNAKPAQPQRRNHIHSIVNELLEQNDELQNGGKSGWLDAIKLPAQRD
jgi:hypothetical protein